MALELSRLVIGTVYAVTKLIFVLLINTTAAPEQPENSRDKFLILKQNEYLRTERTGYSGVG